MKSAARILLSTFGGIVGLIGLEHATGEILQGSVAPGGLMILSWPNAPFFHALNGEPALTVVPNLLVTGILAALFSLAYLAVAVLFIDRRRAALALMLLCIPMLLFGAGIFPPVLGLLVGLGATRLRAPVSRRRAWHASLGRLWPWLFGACLLAWLSMFPGVPVLSYFFGVQNDALIFGLLACMFGLLALAVVAAFARDACATT